MLKVTAVLLKFAARTSLFFDEQRLCPKEYIVDKLLTTKVPLLLRPSDGRAEDVEVAALMWNECGVY